VPSVVAVLSYPFRITPAGSVATVEQDSDDQKEELLAAIVLTRPGERDLVPGFGVPDPTFNGIDVAAVEGATTVFGPEVTITNVDVVVTSPASQDVTVEFE
jgi:hypothetical protein